MEFAGIDVHLTNFEFGGMLLPVEFVKTARIDGYPGVECDFYNFVGDNTKDLGIIRIDPGCKTPPQRVRKGDQTIEGYVSGSGKLVVARGHISIETFEVTDRSGENLSVLVRTGNTIQWKASLDSKLVAYEVCIPRYKPGRFKNLPPKK
jgi:hypothetical protein